VQSAFAKHHRVFRVMHFALASPNKSLAFFMRPHPLCEVARTFHVGEKFRQQSHKYLVQPK
jgi:hypothetical protein